ncbi:MAG: two-component sensor histidine kinase, partial [Paucibacter sp.]|nr:two-component sensor histidine kinase [Roseateles sp.]
AVYWLTVIDLRERQIETLTHKRELVEHLLSEAKLDQDFANLKHKLDDFFLGHRDMALTLIRSDNSVLYDNTATVATAHSAQHISFRYPALDAAGGEINARMVLSTASDDQFLHRLAATLLGAAMTGALVVSFGSFVLVRIGLGPVHFLVDQTMRLEADN